MAIQIKLKNSVVQDSTPSTSDLPAVGEIALNANINSIGGFMRASDNTIVKIFGPGSLSTPTATTTVSGISELATNSETTTGTATNRVVTPAGLNAVTVAERTTSNTNYVAKAGSTLTGVLTMPNGSNSAPAINFGDSDSGIFGGTNTVSLAAGGTTRLTADTGVSVVGTLAVTGAITSTDDLTIPDKIIHSGDTDTAIRFPAANTVSVETGGSEAFRVDGAQRLLHGASSTIGLNRKIQQSGTDASAGLSLNRFSADNGGAGVDFIKSRNATIGNNTIAQNNDNLGIINFRGADGSDLLSIAAQIKGQVDGTPGANDMPGRLVFSTTADGASTPTTRLTIDSAGLSTFTGGITVTGAFASSINDNATDAFTVKQGSNEYITVDTNNSSELITLGNTTTNPKTSILGSGVGIGTTSPSGNFDVTDGTTSISFNKTSNTPRIDFKGNSVSEICQIKAAEAVGGGVLQLFTKTTGGTATERMRIDSSGRVLIGTTATTGGTQLLQVVESTGGRLVLARNDTTVSAEQTLGIIQAYGNDNDGNYQEVASIHFQADKDHGTDDKPGRISLRTTADGASSPTERLRIDSSGNVRVVSGDIRVGDDTDSNAGTQTISVGSVSSGAGGIGIFGNPTNGNSFVQFGDGTAAADQYRGFLNYQHASDSLVFGSAGSERMRIDSSGKVGIGTSSPGVMLDIRANDPGIQLVDTSGTSTYGNIDFIGDTLMITSRGGSTDHGNIDFRGYNGASAVTRMRINPSGNVGIGTTAPAVNLDVSAGSGTAQIYVRNTATSGEAALGVQGKNSSGSTRTMLVKYDNSDAFRFATAQAVPLKFETSDAERMRIDASGRVGIGTSSPDTRLTVATSSGDAFIRTTGGTNQGLLLNKSDGTLIGGFVSGGTVGGSANDVSIRAETGNNITFANATTERMRIDSSGKVGIGTTSPSRKLHVAGSFIRVDDGYGLDTSGSTEKIVLDNGFVAFHVGSERMRINSLGKIGLNTSSPNVRVEMVEDTNSAAVLRVNRSTDVDSVQRDFIEFRRGGTNVGFIKATNSSVAYLTSSDYRLKENAVAISDGITRLKTLKPYRFNFKAAPDTTIDGFFAHEVTAVPEAISGQKDAVEEDGSINPQGIDQSKLVPLLVAAVQELIGKVEALEAA